MLKRVRTALSLSTSLLVFSGYLALSTTIEYGPPILLLPVFIFTLVPVAEWLDARFPSYRRVTTLLTLFLTLSIPVLLLSYNLFPTVVALVIFIQAHKLLHVKNARDYYHIFLMSFFLLVTACVLSPDAAIALPILLFLTSSVWAFHSLQVHVEAVRGPRTPEPEIVSLDERRGRSEPQNRFVNPGLLVTSTAITLACILMTVAFFVATPRMEAGVFGGRNLELSRPVTGLTHTVDLAAAGGEIQRDTSPVMRAIVQLDNEPGKPYSGPLYWRSTSLDRYNGTGWENRSEQTQIYDDAPQPKFMSAGNMIDRTNLRTAKLVKQTIYLDRIPEKGLPCLTLPLNVMSDDARLRWDIVKEDCTVDVAGISRSSILYTVVSEVEEPLTNPYKVQELMNSGAEDRKLLEVPEDELSATDRARVEAIRLAGADYASRFLYLHYRRLTDEGLNLSEETRRLARELTAPYDSTFEKVMAIDRFLSDGDFVYSLSNQAANAENPVDHFIRVSRMGHCELFASAMALMLRSLGIPTRVVTGYRGGEWNPSDGAYTIRADMAHLWVEVYFVDFGWMTFDPSPAESDVPTTVSSRLEHLLYSNLLKGKMFWYQHVVGYSNRTGFEGLRRVMGFLFGWMGGSRVESLGPASITSRLHGLTVDLRTILALLAAGVILGLAAGHYLRGGAGVRRRRLVLSPDQLRAIRLYRDVRGRLRGYGIGPETDTAEDLLRAIRDREDIPVAEADRVLRAYSRTRFGGRPLPRAEFQELRKAARSL